MTILEMARCGLAIPLQWSRDALAGEILALGDRLVVCE